MTAEETISYGRKTQRPSLNLHEGVVVRLSLQGNCDGCAVSSSAMTLKHTIETAIYHAAPDVAAIEVEGVITTTSETTNGFVQIERPNGGKFVDCEFPVAASRAVTS